MRKNFLEFISYKISNPPKGLLKGDLFLLLIFIVPTFFYAAGTSEKGYFALHKSISANSANTTPITGFEHIYISENTLVYTSDDLKNNRPANVQNIKNTKISPQKNSSKASSLIARKKLLKNSKALAYTAPQKSSPHKISKIPMSENFFTRHFQTEAAFFIPRVDHLSEAVRTSYLYSRKIPCTLESGKTPNYNTPSKQSVLRLAISIRPPPMDSPYSLFTV